MIELRHLTKRFEGGFLAVDRLSLSVAAGEVYGLLGPNGAGKTTTLRMILGLLASSSGDSLICGMSVSEQPLAIKHKLGLVSASAGLYQWLTPREVLTYFGTAFGLSRELIHDRIDFLSRTMDLTLFLDRRCAHLSTGQKQRVTLAQALIHDPPVVLLDEPTRGLDVIGAQVVFDLVAHLKERGKAVIVCTHQLDEAERLCDRFGLLYRGRLQHEGTLSDLQTRTGQRGLVEMFLQLLSRDRTSPETSK